MKIRLASAVCALFVLAGSSLFLAGCDSKGPAERAGENIDKGLQNAKDAVDPPGPAEKAGRAADNVVNP